MTDKTKKILKVVCAAGIAVGTVGFILLGGTEVAAGAEELRLPQGLSLPELLLP